MTVKDITCTSILGGQVNEGTFIVAGIKIFGSSTGQKIPILKVVNHPDFSQDWFNNIAIVKLAKPLRFNSNVQQACLPDNSFEPKPNSGAWVSGWSAVRCVLPIFSPVGVY